MPRRRVPDYLNNNDHAKVKAEDIKGVLKRLGGEGDDVRGALHDRISKSIRILGGLNGPYASRNRLKNLLFRIFNFLNRKQFQINNCTRETLETIADEIRTNFNESMENKHPPGTPRVAVFVPFDFRPADFGGATRVYNIYKNLSRSFLVDAVAVAERGLRRCTKAYNNNFTVHIVPHSKEYAELKDSEERKAGGRLHDILLIDQYRLIPELVDLSRRLSYHSDCVIASHPYTFNMLSDLCRDKILIYEAFDIESDIKRTYFYEDNEASRSYLKKVLENEERACRESDLIFAVSKEDVDYMHDHFGIDTSKIVIAENGVDTSRSSFMSPLRRKALKKSLGIDEDIVIFVGSDHGPNIEAVDFIIDELAPRDKSIKYAIGGSIRRHYRAREDNEHLPANVLLLGILPEKEKEALYSIGDLAINPMFSGSGTNLKIFDYGAHGLPIVSTSFGIRGAPALRDCIMQSEKEAFFEAICEQLKEENRIAQQENIYMCRRIIEEKYDWGVIANKMAHAIAELCDKKKPRI